jgi:hypothetical protein
VTTKHQKQVNDRFATGDLVYVPQDVQLWSWGDATVFNTAVPTTGIFIEERDTGVLLFIKGRRMLVKKAHVYPYNTEEK